MNDLIERLDEASAAIASRTGIERHDIAVVLGSGLGAYPASLDGGVTLAYSDIPGFPVPAVEGHAGTLYSATMGTSRVMLLSGRAHAYEGLGMDAVSFPVRTAIRSGVRVVVLTNAAGGCGEHLSPGDLVLITDHINLAGHNPLVGENDQRLGPRFPDMSSVYSTRARSISEDVAAAAGQTLRSGVYAWFLGPSYETPAEVQMAKRMGADLVGMSTVPEAIAARHMGAEVLGISLVTNLAAGISPTPLSHDEVSAAAAAANHRFTALLDGLLPRL